MKIRGSESLPEVRDAGPAAVRRVTNDPAAAGHAAAASVSEQGGQAIAKGLSGFAAGIDKLSADRDRAKATEALNEYMNRSSALLYDPNNGLMLASGAGAEGLSARAYEGHKVLRGEIGGKLSGRQRKLFAEGLAPYDRNVGANVMRREGEQMAKYREEQGILGVKNSAALFANDPDNFSVETQEELVSQYTVAIFGDQGPEANFENSKKVRQMLISQTILAVAVKDPLKAEEVLKREKGSLEPAAREALAAEVEKAALPVRTQELYKSVKGDFAKGIEYIEKNIPEGQQKAYRAEFENYYGDMQKVKNERFKQASTEIARVYLSGGSLSGGQLQKLVDEEIISPEIAITWSNAFDNRVEKQLNIAYRNELRAERAEQKRFKEALRKAYPKEKPFLLLEYNYGVTKTEAQKNYERDRRKMEAQNLSESDILDAVGLGEYTEPQGRLLLKGLKKQDALYNKAAARERKVITDVFKGITGISETDKNAALMSFDEQAFAENVKKDELPFLRNTVLTEVLDKKDYASSWINPFKSQAEKKSLQLKEQGTLNSHRKQNNKPSIDDILGSIGDNP